MASQNNIHEDGTPDNPSLQREPSASYRMPFATLKYKMNHPERGCFVVFNQKNFDSRLELTRRDGTDIDAANLEFVAKGLGFEHVRIFNDCRKKELLRWIGIIAEADHSNYDCFVCCILTHGGEHDFLYAKDDIFALYELTRPFGADRCPSLAGKPKLFFVEAPRGFLIDSGSTGYRTTNVSNQQNESDSLTTPLEEEQLTPMSNMMNIPVVEAQMKSNTTIPNEADFLIFHSTVPGYSTWSDTSNGAIFIQCLCKCLRDYGFTQDIMEILTRVNRMVAYEFESHTRRPELNRKKQMPSATYRLTAKLYFGRISTQQPDKTEQLHGQMQSSLNEDERIAREGFTHGERISDGTGGAVVYFTSQANGLKYAAKVMLTSHYQEAQKEWKMAKQIQVNKEHDNIVRYICSYPTEDRSITIIWQLCGGSVSQLIECKKSEKVLGKSECTKHKPIDQKEGKFLDDEDFLSFFPISTIEIVRQTVNGLAVLHSTWPKAIVHRDIKPSNLLLYKQGEKIVVKVSDFGLSREVHSDRSKKSTTACWTESYTAPEYCDGERIYQKTEADIFSLGLTFYYILTEGCHVYGDNWRKHLSRIADRKAPIFKDLLPTYEWDLILRTSVQSSKSSSETCADSSQTSAHKLSYGEKYTDLTDEQRITSCHLLRWMLQMKPEDRPTITQVKDHPALWDGKRKVEHVEAASEEATKCMSRKKKTKRGGLSLDEFNFFDRSLLEDNEYQRKMPNAKKIYLFGLKEKDTSPNFEFHVESSFLPNGVEGSCDSLQHLYTIVRNRKAHQRKMSKEKQEALKIVPGHEDWDRFLSLFFEKVPQHLIHTWKLLEEAP